LEFQLQDHEPLTENEHKIAIRCESDGFDAMRIAEHIRSAAPG